MKSRKQIVSGNEIKTLRRPFLKELFRNNKFNLVMTVFAALLGSLMNLGISWLIKQISDLISDECPYSLLTLLIVAVSTLLMALMAWVIETIFVSEFRSKSIKQYKEYVFSQLMKKGIQSFSKENSSLYISALSNDVNTIERDFIGQLQSIIQTAITFIGALFLMLWYSPLLTLVSIGFSFIPIIVALILGNKAEKEEQNVSDKKAKYTGMLKDALTGFSVIKSFGAEKNMISLHNSSNENVANSHKKRIKVDIMVGFSSSVSGCILQFGVFFVAAALVVGAFAEDSTFPTGSWVDEKWNGEWVLGADLSVQLKDSNTGALIFNFTDDKVTDKKIAPENDGVVLSFYCKETQRYYYFKKGLSFDAIQSL